MPETEKGDKPLSSWKEIAAYLGCDTRTCVRWEESYGLPVHRLGQGKSRSHVFAYRGELDAWLRKRSGLSDTQNQRKPGPRISRRAMLIFFPILFAGLSLLAILLLSPGRSQEKSLFKEQPDDFRIHGSELVIVNSEGQELWRYETGLKDLVNEAFYRNHFQRRRQVPDSRSRAFPNLVIEDINQDGNREVLFAPKSESSFEGSLLCFDRKGQKLWTFSARRKMTFGRERLTPLFDISSVEIVPGKAPGQTQIVIICNHYPLFPTYVAVLSAAGKPLGEFWNSGRLSDHTFLDMDGDGKSEMVLVGTNNEYAQGCLVVLDLDDVRGGSPQNGNYRAAGLQPGSEKYYLLFPRTVVDRQESQREIFTNIDVPTAGLMIAVSEYSQLSFQLNSKLSVEDVTISDAYRDKYARYQSLGKIPLGKLDEAGLRNELMKGVKYFDGAGWTTTPTPNRTIK